MKERNIFLLILVVFFAVYFIPFEDIEIQAAIIEAFLMLQEYAREHVLLCLVPAFFIAGAIANFVSQQSVIKYFGSKANKVLSYSVASVSGAILAVCSCTVLPLFTGIYKRGAGIGPATAFLYSGPAINVLAIILTARVLGFELGAARAIGAIVFSIIIGFCMHLFFRREEEKNAEEELLVIGEEKEERPLWKTALYFAVMVGILVFVNWGKDESMRIWQRIYEIKWFISGFLIGENLRNGQLRAGISRSRFCPFFSRAYLSRVFCLGDQGIRLLFPKNW